MNNHWKARITGEMSAKQELDATVGEEMKRLHAYHMSQIEKEIQSFYLKYANDNQIAVSDVKKLADKLDVQSFSEKAKRYVEEKNFSPQANAELALYNLKMKVSRMELLQYNMDLEMLALYDGEHKLTEKFLNKEFVSEINFQAGILGEVVAHPKSIATMAQSIINTPYKNATWSERIWDRQHKLRVIVASLTEDALLKGRNALNIIPQLRREFNVSRYEAQRLAVTETARIQTAVQKASYEANNIDEYEFMSEPSACPRCAKLDGTVFKVSEMEPGKNAAPMHPHCHCSTAPRVAKDLKLSQARKTGEKVWITDQAIDKVRLVEIPGYSKIESANIQMAHKQLLQDARDKNDSNEVMYILLGENPIKVFGDQFGVDGNQSVDARFIINSSKERTLTVLHNHPGGSTFSKNDFKFFMTQPSVKTMTIVTNTGRTMYVTKTDKFKINEAMSAIKHLDKTSDDFVVNAFKVLYNHGIRYKSK